MRASLNPKPWVPSDSTLNHNLKHYALKPRPLNPYSISRCIAFERRLVNSGGLLSDLGFLKSRGPSCGSPCKKGFGFRGLQCSGVYICPPPSTSRFSRSLCPLRCKLWRVQYCGCRKTCTIFYPLSSRNYSIARFL